MLESVFTGLTDSAAASLTVTSFLLCIAAALVLGAALAWVYAYRSRYTKSFAITLALLPAIVSIVIMMVSGSLGAGVAVAGTFSLVRFRSVPGTAKEICAIFMAMAVGLACGMGYPGFAALFTLIMVLASLFYSSLTLGEEKDADRLRTLQITVPEELDYTGAFSDLFDKYTSSTRLLRVKTTNLGSLNKLSYDITLKEPGTEKDLIDELRCRNGNLEISAALPGTDSTLL